MITRRLTLYETGNSTVAVETVDSDGIHDHYTQIGTAHLNPDGLWSAYALNGDNHGNRYLDRWSAAKQLALGLGKGEYV